MSIATATNATTDWIASALVAYFDAADPAISAAIFIASAPWDEPRPVRDAASPYVTVRHLGSTDKLVIGGEIIASEGRFEVTAWEEGTDTERVKPIVEAIHAALHKQRGGVVDDMVISGCVREAAVERQVVEGDYFFTQMGGEYVVRLSIT